MPNLPYNTGYWKFNVKNVFNTVCLSSYALKQTPLKFIPSSTEYDTLYSNHYIMWDFGDGSTMQKAYSAEHYFFNPGEYRVTMNLVLSTGEAVLDSYNQIVFSEDPDRGGVNNLLGIYKSVTGKNEDEVVKDFESYQ